MKPAAAITGRLAPSPTGRLHIGHARSFLAAWWSARSKNGRVLLRIEDLDRDRCRPEYTAGIFEDLTWLGLDWDGEPLVQSEDLEPYAEAVRRLLEQDLAFPCVCSRRDLEPIQSAPHGRTGERRYPGTCAHRFQSLEEAERSCEVPVGVRLRVEPGSHSIQDGLFGDVQFEPAEECGDFVLLRRDGQIAYQLAVCVDDARQGINQVVRGDDLLPSAARQELVHHALGSKPPAWTHLPLVEGPGGDRLAKRDGGSTLEELRQAGLDPRELVAWCARSLGIELPSNERASADELTRAFRWDRVPLRPASWSPSQ